MLESVYLEYNEWNPNVNVRPIEKRVDLSRQPIPVIVGHKFVAVPAHSRRHNNVTKQGCVPWDWKDDFVIHDCEVFSWLVG